MEKKSFKKYFTQTKKILYAGIGVFVAGFILFLLIYFNIIRSFDLYQAAWLIMVAGVVMIMCHFTIRVRDGAVDEYAATFRKELENELEEFVNESEKHKKINRVFSYTSGGYELWNENTDLIVFGNDNTPPLYPLRRRRGNLHAGYSVCGNGKYRPYQRRHEDKPFFRSPCRRKRRKDNR